MRAETKKGTWAAVLLCGLLIGGCAKPPKVVLPPDDAEPASRALAYHRYQVRSIEETRVTEGWGVHSWFEAELNTGERVRNPRHLLAIVPDSRELKKYSRRHQTFNILSWSMVPLTFAAVTAGAFELRKGAAKGQRLPRNAIIWISSGLVFSIAHLVLHRVGANSAKRAFRSFNPALQARLKMQQRKAGPEFLPAR